MSNAQISTRMTSSSIHPLPHAEEEGLSDSETMSYLDKRKRSLSPDMDDTLSNSSKESDQTRSGEES